MENRWDQAAKVVLKVQTLSLIPALNVSKSLGKFRPGILIQHFIIWRTNMGLHPLVTSVGAIPVWVCALPPSEAGWSHQIPSAPCPEQKVLYPILPSSENGPWHFGVAAHKLCPWSNSEAQDNLKQGVPVSASVHNSSVGHTQDPGNKTTALYSHLDSVDLLNGLRVFAGGCQSINSVCRDPTHCPCVQQVGDGPQATRTVRPGADARWRIFSVLLRSLSLVIIRRQQIHYSGNKQTYETQGRIQATERHVSHCAVIVKGQSQHFQGHFTLSELRGRSD